MPILGMGTEKNLEADWRIGKTLVGGRAKPRRHVEQEGHGGRRWERCMENSLFCIPLADPAPSHRVLLVPSEMEQRLLGISLGLG